MLRVWFCSLVFIFTSSVLLEAQTDAERSQLETQLKSLQESLAGRPTDDRVDAEICAKAVEWILRHDEFFKKDYVKSAQRTLRIGHRRIDEIGSSKWWEAPGKHALAYRSRIDDSVQPYVVTVPESFTQQRTKRWPLHVVLHGRNKNLTEAHFIASQDGKAAPAGQDWIQLDVFGRTNNAYRWAGETDVFEALDDVIRRFSIDESRITLWGFSMGGAGAWHLGLHHPSRWASVGAGAGFVDFYEYQKQTEQLPDYQHRTLRIYDAKDYALNLSVVPFITYGGEVDPQLRASQIIKEQADQLDVPLQTLVGPGMGHKFDDASKASFMEFLIQNNQKGRKRGAGRREFRFVTYTLKYNRCEWLTIHEQSTPYAKTLASSVMNENGDLELTTENIEALSVLRTATNRLSIDGSKPFNLNTIGDDNLIDVYFVKEDGNWVALDYEESLEFEENPQQHKRHNLQGPIDDAFMEPFVCVTGTGRPWSKEIHDYANWSLERFKKDFDKWMRAKPIVVSDDEVTEELIRNRNLILFGDPGSNKILKRVVDDLPVEWKSDSITFMGNEYSSEDHALVMIFPNPLNPRHYVVINSGMTTHEKDFKASNSWLFPKLGDYAVIRFSKYSTGEFDETVESAGIFDSIWNK